MNRYSQFKVVKAFVCVYCISNSSFSLNFYHQLLFLTSQPILPSTHSLPSTLLFYWSFGLSLISVVTYCCEYHTGPSEPHGSSSTATKRHGTRRSINQAFCNPVSLPVLSVRGEIPLKNISSPLHFQLSRVRPVR